MILRLAGVMLAAAAVAALFALLLLWLMGWPR